MIDNVQDNGLISTVKQICKEEKIKITSISADWVYMLEKDGKHRFIYGREIGLNSKTAAMLAKDKSATSKILAAFDINCVEHEIFTHSRYTKYVNEEGNWDAMKKYAKKYNFNVVCKTNQGSSGVNVFKVSSQRELEEASYEILKEERNVVLSPYYKADKEYRIIMLDGEPMLVYSKNKAVLIGDGKKDIMRLLIDKYGVENLNKFLDKFNVDLGAILNKGEKLELNWKFNLHQGAIAKLDVDDEKEVLVDIAKKAVMALGLRFCSVDILKIGSEYKVLEVNGNVVIGKFVDYIENGDKIRKEVYRKAVLSMF